VRVEKKEETWVRRQRISMQNAYIIGVGMNRFGRYPDETVRTMAEEVVHQA
jgi:hypothetical protein